MHTTTTAFAVLVLQYPRAVDPPPGPAAQAAAGIVIALFVLAAGAVVLWLLSRFAKLIYLAERDDPYDRAYVEDRLGRVVEVPLGLKKPGQLGYRPDLDPSRPASTRSEDVEAAKRRVGREAELAVADELRPLVRRGYFLFSNVEHRAFGDVDHVLVGPGGVFVVETKGHRGAITADEISGELLRDGEPFEKDFRAQAERQASHLAGSIFNSGRSVRYFVCFARGEVRPNRRGEIPAGVCSLRNLRASILASDHVLSPELARKIVRRIGRVNGSYPVS